MYDIKLSLLLLSLVIFISLLVWRKRSWNTVASRFSFCIPSAFIAWFEGGILNHRVDEDEYMHPEFAPEAIGATNIVFVGRVGDLFSANCQVGKGWIMGEGTFGRTFQAQIFTQCTAAVKKLDRQIIEFDLFGQHMGELGELHHPNLVPIIAYGQTTEEGKFLIIYKHFDHSLKDEIKPLSVYTVLKIASDVVAGLMYLHRANYVHGNLKPSNIIFDPNLNSYCLIDYCLSNYYNHHYFHNIAHSETYNYSAPECRPIFTPHSDIYSFGILLVDLLTNTIISHDHINQLGVEIFDHITTRHKEKREDFDVILDTPVLNGLANIAKTCLETTPESRLTVEALALKIQRMLSGQPP